MHRSLACAMGLVLVLALSTSAAAPPTAAGGPTRRVLDLRVLERDGEKPVAGVAIQSVTGRTDKLDFRATTDNRGRCVVPVPPGAEKSHHFAVYAWKDGFVPVRVLWGHTREFEFEGIPAAYTLTFDRGTPIGGVVRDEKGQPIAGARVFPAFIARPSDMEYLDLPRDTSFITDAQGRWRCTILPESWNTGKMDFRVEHSRFVSSGRIYDRLLPIKDLRALTSAIVMETGFNVSGAVTDLRGKPIEGATVVWWGAEKEDGQVRVKVGASGRFEFENRPPGISLITAEVPGLATGVKQVCLGPPDPNQPLPMVPINPIFPIEARQPANDASIGPIPPAVTPAFFASDVKQLAKDGPCEPPMEFRLGQGRTIRGRVVDVKGRPIAGVRITPEFRGFLDLLGWRGETGADGQFQWTNAPLEVIVLNVENPAEGQMVRCVGPGAQDSEIVVTMPAPFRLRGKVVDAETGRPIDQFQLIKGTVWTRDFAPKDDDSPPNWSLGRGDTTVGGRYEVRFPALNFSDEIPDNCFLVIRIEAEGYAPAISRKYGAAEGEQTCDFSLRKHPWIMGTVHAPDGSPVAGADVVVAIKGRPAPRFYNGRLAQGWQGDVVRTGPDGRFAFAKHDHGGRIIVVSDRGLAQRAAEELMVVPVVTLEPWGRIRGQLRVGTTIGPGRFVGAVVSAPDDRGEPVVSFSARALTDNEGRFLLDRVAPGHAMVFRPHWIADGTSYRSHRQGVDVASGQAAEVLMGRAGRPVVGRLTRAAGLPSFDLNSVTGRLRLVQPDPEFPAGFEEWDHEKQRVWWHTFYATKQGRRYYERANAYVVKVETDGLFHVDDVPEGRYRLNFEYETKSVELIPEPKKVTTKVAALEAYVDVPAGPEEQPLDIGALTLTPLVPDAVDR